LCFYRQHRDHLIGENALLPPLGFPLTLADLLQQIHDRRAKDRTGAPVD
jgi:hypothetical protein